MSSFKMVFFLILIMAICTFAQEGSKSEPSQKASTESNIGAGARLAVGYGFIWGLDDDWSGGENDENPGGLDLELGVMGRYAINSVIHFTPELLFRYAKLTQDDNLGEREFTQMDLQIPLLIRANATPKLYGYIGPQIGFNLSSDVSIEANNDKFLVKPSVSFSDNVDQATFYFGLTAGIGYYLIEKLSVDIRAYLGLTELYPDAKSILVDLSSAKLMSFKIGINYWII